MHSHPDFVCVGAQKAGTAWLYDQAHSHPRVWMPPLKEIRYFMPIFGQVKRQAAKRLCMGTSGQKKGRPLDERDREFLRRAARAKGAAEGASLDEYLDLFEPAGEFVTGDVTPGYHALNEATISELATGLPNCRFIFLMRDPIGRLWSQVNMMVRAEKSAASALENRQVFERLVLGPQYVSHSFQSNAIRRWLDIIGSERFAVFVMDELRVDPVGYRRAVFAYIGLNADECAVEAGYNRKTNERKTAMPDHYWDFLLDYFGEEYEKLAPFVDRRKIAWPPRNRNVAAPVELDALERDEAGAAARRAGGAASSVAIGLS
jgi:hypothetical protein